jgi:hypothetical protein
MDTMVDENRLQPKFHDYVVYQNNLKGMSNELEQGIE